MYVLVRVPEARDHSLRHARLNSQNRAAWAVRGSRKWPSRVVSAPMRPVRTVSVIAGPDDHGNACVLYTAFGGPTTPREPGDTSMNDEQVAESKAFWAQHALATG